MERQAPRGLRKRQGPTTCSHDRETIKSKMRLLLQARSETGGPGVLHETVSSSIPADGDGRADEVRLKDATSHKNAELLLLPLPPELWMMPFEHLDLRSRVRARAVCTAFAAAGGPDGAQPLPAVEVCSESTILHNMAASTFARRMLNGLRQLKLIGLMEGCGATPVSVQLPFLPALELLEVQRCYLCAFETEACPALSSFAFDWETCCGLLRRFSLVAGPCFATADSVQPTNGDCFDLYALKVPGFQGVLDLSELGGVEQLVLHSPSPSLQILWPDRWVLRRAKRLDLNLAADTGIGNRGGRIHGWRGDSVRNDSLSVEAFACLHSLSICTPVPRVLLPTAGALRTLVLEAPEMTHLDLSEWTAFGDLRNLELRNCHMMVELRLPLCGDLRTVRLHVGARLSELRLHMRAADDLVLNAPGLQRLHVACRTLNSSVLATGLSGCSSLRAVVLTQCVELPELVLVDSAERTLPGFQSLDLGGFSRVHRLTAIRLASPSLSQLILPPVAIAHHTRLRRLHLSCPSLATLDLRSLHWKDVEDVDVCSGALATLRPPKGMLTMEAAEADEHAWQSISVTAGRLLLVDLSGAMLLTSIRLNLSAQGARVIWPSRHANIAPVKLELAVPDSENPMPTDSPLNSVLESVDLSGCDALSPKSLVAAVSRWPRLASLDLGAGIGSGLGVSDDDLIQLAQVASSSLKTLRCGRCQHLSRFGLSAALEILRVAAAGDVHIEADIPVSEQGESQVRPSTIVATHGLRNTDTYDNRGNERFQAAEVCVADEPVALAADSASACDTDPSCNQKHENCDAVSPSRWLQLCMPLPSFWSVPSLSCAIAAGAAFVARLRLLRRRT